MYRWIHAKENTCAHFSWETLECETSQLTAIRARLARNPLINRHHLKHIQHDEYRKGTVDASYSGGISTNLCLINQAPAPATAAPLPRFTPLPLGPFPRPAPRGPLAPLPPLPPLLLPMLAGGGTFE